MARRRRRRAALLTVLADGAGVVVQLDNRKYYPLSSSGVRLWRLYDDDKDVDDDDLVLFLLRHFVVEEGRARADVDAFVDRLTSAGILVKCDGGPA